MSHSYNNAPSFAQRGITFGEIFSENACGGVPMIETYLQTRRKIIVRDMATVKSSDKQMGEYIRILNIFDNAIEVLLLLSKNTCDIPPSADIYKNSE